MFGVDLVSFLQENDIGLLKRVVEGKRYFVFISGKESSLRKGEQFGYCVDISRHSVIFNPIGMDTEYQLVGDQGDIERPLHTIRGAPTGIVLVKGDNSYYDRFIASSA